MSSNASADTGQMSLASDAARGQERSSTTVGATRSFATVTVTVAAVPVPPLVSRATAVRKCVPLVAVVVSHEIE